MNPPPRLVVVGSCMVDQIARAPRVPNPGETLVGTSYQIGFGGKGANQAVMAAKLGAHVTMVAKLGTDPFGRETLENFRTQGVDVSAVTFAEGLPSGVAPIWVDERTGQNSILVIPGANAALTPADVQSAGAAISAAHAVITQLETPIASTLAAFTLAREAGVTTLLNPAPAAPLPPELIALTDILIPNEPELAALTGRPTSTLEDCTAAARELLAQGVRTVVVTLGERGSLLVTANAATPVPGEPVTAVDTTGAGDCFIGSFAFFLAAGLPAAEAIHRANRIAARSVLTPGTQTSFPAAGDLPADLFCFSR